MCTQIESISQPFRRIQFGPRPHIDFVSLVSVVAAIISVHKPNNERALFLLVCSRAKYRILLRRQDEKMIVNRFRWRFMCDALQINSQNLNLFSELGNCAENWEKIDSSIVRQPIWAAQNVRPYEWVGSSFMMLGGWKKSPTLESASLEWKFLKFPFRLVVDAVYTSI